MRIAAPTKVEQFSITVPEGLDVYIISYLTVKIKCFLKG